MKHKTRSMSQDTIGAVSCRSLPLRSAKEACIAGQVIQEAVGGFVKRRFHAAGTESVAALLKRLTTAQRSQAINFQNLHLDLVEELHINANCLLYGKGTFERSAAPREVKSAPEFVDM